MRVFERIANEAWVSPDLDAQEQLARHVIQTYEAGIVDEARLYALCRAMARDRCPSISAAVPHSDPPPQQVAAMGKSL
jgi:hypothetical protein